MKITSTFKVFLSILFFGLPIFLNIGCDGEDDSKTSPEPPSSLKNNDILIYKRIALGESDILEKITIVVVELADGRLLDFGSAGSSAKIKAQSQTEPLVTEADISAEKVYGITFKADDDDTFEAVIKDGITVYLNTATDGSSTIRYLNNIIPAELTEEQRTFFVDRFNNQVKNELALQGFSFNLVE